MASIMARSSVVSRRSSLAACQAKNNDTAREMRAPTMTLKTVSLSRHHAPTHSMWSGCRKRVSRVDAEVLGELVEVAAIAVGESISGDLEPPTEAVEAVEVHAWEADVVVDEDLVGR